jgi:hypothetical protein
MTCFLQYSKVGEEEFLEGSYTSISVRDSTQCGGGTVFLRKVATSDFYKEPFLVEKEKNAKKDPPVVKTKPVPPAAKPNPAPQQQNKIAPPVVKKTPAPPKKEVAKTTPKRQTPAPAIKKKEELKQLSTDSIVQDAPVVSAPVPLPRVLSTRKNELVKTITSSAKQVSINIYDNGTIDNDTVSVYIDNKLVISRQRLTEQPITVTINLDDNHEHHELIMVAENLGEIPPNTSLMVVSAGEERYEVRITSTEQKNAVVRFKKGL